MLAKYGKKERLRKLGPRHGSRHGSLVRSESDFGAASGCADCTAHNTRLRHQPGQPPPRVVIPLVRTARACNNLQDLGRHDRTFR